MAKVYIDTLGCPKNQDDSERAAGLMASAGHHLTASEEESDIIIINTCGFIEDARRESIARILEAFALKEEGKKVIVSGCLTQRYGEELFDELPEADALIGVNDYDRLPEIISGLLEDEAPTRKLMTRGAEGLLTGPRYSLAEQGATRYLKVAEGCSNRCAYCAIPMIRGPYRSVPARDILAEAERLAGEGAKELILIAQDVSAWGSDLPDAGDLPALLRALCKVDGPLWIRLMYCYEERITDSLIQVMAEEEKICPYIDIPLQHCSDRVLKAMGRRSTRASVEDTIRRLRTAIPDIAIRTTLMTGFPGESEAAFQELSDFVSEKRFERLGVFAFSPEEGTAAALMTDQVPSEVAAERREHIMLKQLDISLEHNRRLVGRALEVLTEIRDVDGSYVGRTRRDAPEIDNSVLFASKRPLAPGDLTKVLITDAMDYDLIGETL